MKNTGNIWLLVGRETEGNNIKNYILMDYMVVLNLCKNVALQNFVKNMKL